MNFEELKRLFQCQQFESTAKLSSSDQIKLIRKRMKAMHRLSPWVAAMEIVVAVGVLLFGAWLLLFHMKVVPLVSRIGFWIMIFGPGFDIWGRMLARRMSPMPLADEQVTQWVRHELEKLRAQSELKGTDLLRDLLLFWIGAILVAWGMDDHLWSRIFLSAFLMGMGVIICAIGWKVNQFRRRKTNQPLIAELESLLKSNNPENPTEP